MSNYPSPTQRERQRALRRRRHRQRQIIAAASLLLALILLITGCVKGVRAIHAHFSKGEEETVQEDLPASDALAEAESQAPLEEDAVDKLEYIQTHPELYPEELIELAEKNEEALDYVYQYPELHGQEPDCDLSAEAGGDTVPLLLQWDTRWGYHSYGSGMIGYNGCGPTCLSMVALYLTGNADYTPAYIADYSYESGYYVDGSGTTWLLMSHGGASLGLTATELPMDENRMSQALSQGQPIICSMGPGDFTTTGHYIVITGYADGAFTVNDPNSRERSERTWTFDELYGQVRNLWAFSNAD